MNRRNFFKQLAVAIISAPAIVKAIGESTPPTIRLEPKSFALTKKPRTLSAKWTVEMEQELQSFHGISADELAKIMSDEISREMDKELLELMNRRGH
jgi:hypothetical protein